MSTKNEQDSDRAESPKRKRSLSWEGVDIVSLGKSRRSDRIARLESKLGTFMRVVHSCPERYQSLLTKALLGEATPGQAIKAHCQQCVGYEEVVVRVGDCGSKACPLWHHRPYQSAAEDDE